MCNENIIVESVWSSPEVSAFFLERCEIYLQIRNKSKHPIQIDKVECRFKKYEPDVDPYTPQITPMLVLDPGKSSSPIRIIFHVDLSLLDSTNGYYFLIHYHDYANNTTTFEHDPNKYLIFNSIESSSKTFFISHKDPEDTKIARQLAHFLKKTGFIGYLSEDNKHPGVNLWKEKIPNTIMSCVGLIILWTTESIKAPENICQEIKLAKSYAKPLIMAREKGVTIPEIFPKQIEYHEFSTPLTASELKNLACIIEDTYRSGGYS